MYFLMSNGLIWGLPMCAVEGPSPFSMPSGCRWSSSIWSIHSECDWKRSLGVTVLSSLRCSVLHFFHQHVWPNLIASSVEGRWTLEICLRRVARLCSLALHLRH